MVGGGKEKAPPRSCLIPVSVGFCGKRSSDYDDNDDDDDDGGVGDGSGVDGGGADGDHDDGGGESVSSQSGLKLGGEIYLSRRKAWGCCKSLCTSGTFDQTYCK